MRQSAGKALAAVATLLCACSLLGAPTAALAQTGHPTVSGVDSLEPTAEAWELLRVDGHSGDPLYIDVTRTEGDKTTLLVSRQRHDLGQTDGSVAHIVSVALEGATPADVYADPEAGVRYGVAVHTAARGGETLYEGTVYPVYARLESGGSVEELRLLGIRTASAAEVAAGRNIGLGAALYGDGADGGREAWALDRTVNGTPGRDNRFEGGAFVGTYRKAAPGSVTGSVTYVDREGTSVRVDSFPGIEAAGVDAPVEQSFFSDGVYYRVLSGLSGTTVRLTAANPHRTVRVAAVPGADAGAYQVTVRYVDDRDGSLLWSDSVDVRGKGFRYTLPEAFSMGGTDGVSHYRLSSVEGGAAGAWANPLLLAGDLSAAHFGVDADGRRTLTARYTSSEVSREAVFTVVEVDGSTSAEIGRVTQTVTPDVTATYTPAPRTVGGVRLSPAAVSAQTLTYGWDDLAAGRDLVAYVYYVPEGWVAGSPYDIEVRSVDVATGATIASSSHRVSPETNDYLRVVGEERISANGEQYVRLPGQEAGISHSFFSPTRTYTVYYRNVNDQLNANTVVRRTQVVETERVVTLPGETVVVRGSVTSTPTRIDGTTGGGAPAGTGTTGGTAGAGTGTGDTGTGRTTLPFTGSGGPDTEAGVAAGDGAVIVNGDDNPLATLDGRGTTQERVDDDDNPLSAHAAGVLPIVAGAVAGLAAAAVLVYLLVIRKKKADTSGSKSV